MTKKFNLKRICISFLVGFCLCALVVYLIAGDAFFHKTVTTSTVDAANTVGEIYGDQIVRQNFNVSSETIEAYELQFATYGRSNECSLVLQIVDETGSVLAENRVDAKSLTDQAGYTVALDQPIQTPEDGSLQLVIFSPDAQEGNAVSVYFGDSIRVGKGSVAQHFAEDEKVSVGGETLDGTLCLVVTGKDTLWFGSHYWLFFAGVLALLIIYALVLLRKEQQGKESKTLNFIGSLYRYHFLIKQLVTRDFKTKYRRSVLGVFWSFLNPLLTMLVQYVVFSTLFNASIPHYPVYLLSGIVLYNFFNETTSVGLTAITENAPLITKVFVPKYIYPLTRTLSAAINILFSLIPLFAVAIFTGIMPAFSWLLLLYVLLCTMGFALGITYLLSTLMVYFRDIKFLWSVIVMVWMYCTPIFYPDSIIPESLRGIYHMNPLYQLIAFARTALIDRVSPGPSSYLACFVIAAIPLIVGIWVFNRREKDFALYL